jgi:hypothetical protein
MLVDNLKASGHSFYEEQLGFAQEANLTSLERLPKIISG